MSRVSMQQILLERAVARFQSARERVNPERRFFKEKGMTGKDKKKFRRFVRARNKERIASAKLALESSNKDLVPGAMND